MTKHLLSVIALLLVPIGGCDEPLSVNCDCTAINVALHVAVVDTNGTLVPGLKPVVSVVRTGEVLTFFDPGGGPYGYTVFTDSEKRLVESAPERIRFTVTSGGKSAQAEFVVSASTPCQCHVVMDEGPAQIVLR